MKYQLGNNQGILGYLFMSPILVFYAIFLLIPTVFSLYLSFTEWGGFDLAEVKWVGLENFKELFSPSSNFLYPILSNTFLFAFGTVIISFICALAVAYFITRLRFEGFWRTLYFLPSVTTVVAIGNIWMHVYNPTNGILNSILNKFGIANVNFLNDQDLALGSIIIVGGWLGIGSSMLILSAGLKAISDDYYEAATLEGAGLWRLFLSVTLPLLRPSIMFVLITSFIGGLQSFTLTMVMTKSGGPGDSTNVVGLEMYNRAFSFGDWGLASSMAFVLFICILIVTFIQLKFFKQGGVENY